MSSYGSKPIKDSFPRDNIIDAEELKALRSYSEILLQFSAAELVGIIHWPKGAWSKRYVPGEEGDILSSADIVEEYRARIKFAGS